MEPFASSPSAISERAPANWSHRRPSSISAKTCRKRFLPSAMHLLIFVYDQPVISPISAYEYPCALRVSARTSWGFSALSASPLRTTRSRRASAIVRPRALGRDRIERVPLIVPIGSRSARRSEQPLPLPAHRQRFALGDGLHPADEGVALDRRRFREQDLEGALIGVLGVVRADGVPPCGPPEDRVVSLDQSACRTTARLGGGNCLDGLVCGSGVGPGPTGCSSQQTQTAHLRHIQVRRKLPLLAPFDQGRRFAICEGSTESAAICGGRAQNWGDPAACRAARLLRDSARVRREGNPHSCCPRHRPRRRTARARDRAGQVRGRAALLEESKPRTKFVFLKATVGSDGFVTPGQPETISISRMAPKATIAVFIEPPPTTLQCGELYFCDVAPAAPATGSPALRRQRQGPGGAHLRDAGQLLPGDRPVQPEDPHAGDLRGPAADPHRRPGHLQDQARPARELRLRAGDRAGFPPNPRRWELPTYGGGKPNLPAAIHLAPARDAAAIFARR